jgi:hypothetical protein
MLRRNSVLADLSRNEGQTPARERVATTALAMPGKGLRALRLLEAAQIFLSKPSSLCLARGFRALRHDRGLDVGTHRRLAMPGKGLSCLATDRGPAWLPGSRASLCLARGFVPCDPSFPVAPSEVADLAMPGKGLGSLRPDPPAGTDHKDKRRAAKVVEKRFFPTV